MKPIQSQLTEMKDGNQVPILFILKKKREKGGRKEKKIEKNERIVQDFTLNGRIWWAKGCGFERDGAVGVYYY
ncbi:hypothetical protein [Psychrobacillus sp. L3]|uniref:hypothetical protein n=1 Tax=Psychrobacillus sp. L3 TaxID=3236891 RepID=UPI0036F27A47